MRRSVGLVFALATFGATPAPVDGGPGNGSCSDATAELVYTSYHYQGGAHPFPGMIVGDQKLHFRGQLVGRTITRYFGDSPGEDGETEQPWEVSLQFLSRTKRVLERTGTSESGSETFAQKVEIHRTAPDSSSPLPAAVHVICQDNWDLMRP